MMTNRRAGLILPIAFASIFLQLVAFAASTCDGTSDAYGPCTDPGTYIPDSANIPAGCARCPSSLRFDYVGGACLGTDNREGRKNCESCSHSPGWKKYAVKQIPLTASEKIQCFALVAACVPSELPQKLCGKLVGIVEAQALCKLLFAWAPPSPTTNFCDCINARCQHGKCVPDGNARSSGGSKSSCQ